MNLLHSNGPANIFRRLDDSAICQAYLQVKSKKLGTRINFSPCELARWLCTFVALLTSNTFVIFLMTIIEKVQTIKILKKFTLFRVLNAKFELTYISIIVTEYRLIRRYLFSEYLYNNLSNFPKPFCVWKMFQNIILSFPFCAILSKLDGEMLIYWIIRKTNDWWQFLTQIVISALILLARGENCPSDLNFAGSLSVGDRAIKRAVIQTKNSMSTGPVGLVAERLSSKAFNCYRKQKIDGSIPSRGTNFFHLTLVLFWVVRKMEKRSSGFWVKSAKSGKSEKSEKMAIKLAHKNHSFHFNFYFFQMCLLECFKCISSTALNV